jgi:hypothetical protein
VFEELAEESQKGSEFAPEVQKKRSSSERKDVGREDDESEEESDSPREERRGQEGKAQVVESWAEKLEGVRDMWEDIVEERELWEEL